MFRSFETMFFVFIEMHKTIVINKIIPAAGVTAVM